MNVVRLGFTSVSIRADKLYFFTIVILGIKKMIQYIINIFLSQFYLRSLSSTSPVMIFVFGLFSCSNMQSMKTQ